MQPDAAISGCNAVIQETTKNLAAAYYFRAAASEAKKDFDRAIADYTQAIAIDPTEVDYLNGRAGAYEAKNDMNRAMADYDKAIQLNPKSVYAYNNRGATFQRKGDFARASADYGEVTKLQPNNPDAWAARCWVRAAGGREVQQALSDRRRRGQEHQVRYRKRVLALRHSVVRDASAPTAARRRIQFALAAAKLRDNSSRS